MLGEYKKLKLLDDSITGPLWVVKDKTDKEYTAKLFPLIHEEKLRELIPRFKSLKNERLAKCIDGFKDEKEKAYVVVSDYFNSKYLVIDRW